MVIANSRVLPLTQLFFECINRCLRKPRTPLALWHITSWEQSLHLFCNPSVRVRHVAKSFAGFTSWQIKHSLAFFRAFVFVSFQVCRLARFTIIVESIFCPLVVMKITKLLPLFASTAPLMGYASDLFVWHLRRHFYKLTWETSTRQKDVVKIYYGFKRLLFSSSSLPARLVPHSLPLAS